MREFETLDQALPLQVGQLSGVRQFRRVHEVLKGFAVVAESLFPANILRHMAFFLSKPKVFISV